MRALIVVESMFGNTREAARSLARGLFPTMDADLTEVGRAPSRVPSDVGLLIVGGPTHAFGMTRGSTRADARSGGAPDSGSPDVGIREWLADLEEPDGRMLAVAFDTRVNRPRLPGSAARGVHRRLRALGFELVDSPRSYWVEGTDGPLATGETERARAWGAELARIATTRSALRA